MKLRRLLLLPGLAACVLANENSLAAVDCPDAPLFDLSGPTCMASRQDSPCGCSECMMWDPADGANWYEITRCDAAGGGCTITGDTRFKNRAGHQTRMWCFAWDAPFPVLGASYDYAVRACKDGPTGPICSTGLSNAVRYVTAPYMCIENGIEVECVASTPWAAGDTEGDGITDALDPDDDGDGVPDEIDGCSLQPNVGRRDGDGDGIGDACDPEPGAATPGGSDTDRDGIADRFDVCPWVFDPAQRDLDGDRSGDACDRCVDEFDDRQGDVDADGQGDRCDVDDGRTTTIWASKTRLSWEPEGGSPSWSVYRGDLAELRRSGIHAQDTGSFGLAARWCGLSATEHEDATLPGVASAAFFLVGAGSGSVGAGHGRDGTGAVLRNVRFCP